MSEVADDIVFVAGDWRVSRGESLRNLEAFRHLLERPGDPPPAES